MSITFLKANGSYDTKINQPEEKYEGIGWQEIKELAETPQSTTKLDAAFIIPSSYKEHDGRCHQAQKEHGKYHMLAIDVDDGNHSIDFVLGSVEAIIGDCYMVAYSSSSAEPDNRKWRVLIPIKNELSGKQYSQYQKAFFDLLEDEGINPDHVLARYGQVIYLPNVPPEKRDEKGNPNFYESKIVKGKAALDITDHHAIAVRAKMQSAEQERIKAEIEVEREKRKAERERKLAENPNLVSPIEEFNARHSIEELFLRYGYEQKGNSKSWKSRYQSTGSYATKNFEDHWVSLSGSDVSAGVGNKKDDGATPYCWGDAFSLFVHYEHNDDLANAVRAYGQEINLSKEEYKKEKHMSAEEIFKQVNEQQSASEVEQSEQTDENGSSLMHTVFSPSQAKPILKNNYIIKNWISKGQMSVVYGPSNSGKSFMCLDACFCIAAGLEWHGNRVNQGPVLYLALEGGLSYYNRVWALREKYEVDEAPLYVRPSPVDLLNKDANLREVALLCKEIKEKHGPLQLLCVDTLSRAMAGGNENGPEDMTAVIKHSDLLREYTGAHVMFVHHSGKNVSAGARGHSSLRAATDAEIELEHDKDNGIRVAKTTKQRDLETGKEFVFKLSMRELGEDEDGDQVTTVVVEQAESNGLKDSKIKPITSQNHKKLLETYRQMCGDGRAKGNPAGTGFPEAGRFWCVDAEIAQEIFKGKIAIKDKNGTWRDTIKAMEKNGQIVINGGLLWFLGKHGKMKN